MLSGSVSAIPISAAIRPPNLTCLTGFVQRRPPVSIFQRGTHLLVGVGGNVLATLRSNQVNLSNLEGRFVTLCGINEGQIEGVTSLLVTTVLSANVPGGTPIPQPINLQLLLLLLLLSQPNLLRGVNPLQLLLLSSLLGGGSIGI